MVSNTTKNYNFLDLQMPPLLLSGALRFGNKKHVAMQNLLMGEVYLLVHIEA
jgi:hypothetical protein